MDKFYKLGRFILYTNAGKAEVSVIILTNLT